MKAWIECEGCAFSDFRDAPSPNDAGRCRLKAPLLISHVQEPHKNPLTQKVELRSGAFGGQPHVRRRDGCAEGRPEVAQ